MDKLSPYNAILRTYFEGGNSIAAKMLNRGYLTRPAKTADYANKDYLSDQSLYTHIVNGAFALTRLLTFLYNSGSYQLDDQEYRKVLAIFTIHDLHKYQDVEKGRRGEFDIPLSVFQEEGEILGLFDFADVSVEQLRIGMMHLNKNMVGDFLNTPRNTSKLITLVRMADTFASLQEPSQHERIEVNLHELSPRLIGRYKFYHHELNGCRGLSTQLLHTTLSNILENYYQCYPLLFFANGVMYIGPSDDTTPELKESLATVISKQFFASIQQKMESIGNTVAQSALHAQQTVKFEQYAYLFSNPLQLSESLAAHARKKPPKFFISELVRKHANRRPSFAEKYPSSMAFCHRYEIDPKAENNKDFAAKWWMVNQYIKGVESIARDMLGDKETLPWLFKILQTPEDIKLNIIADIAELKSGGVTDYCLIIAYHYLLSQIYNNELSASAAESGEILVQLQTQLLPHIQMLMNEDVRQIVMDHELALTQDFSNYLAESVFCSHPAFSNFEHNPGKVFSEYQRRRTAGTHLHLCVICGRVIPSEMKIPTIKTSIIENQARVFSNKLVPRVEVGPQMVWCPMCYLEFTLRKLAGLGYPPGAANSLSDRLYIYLFPDYFFTPEQVEMMKDVFDMFTDQTILKLRRYGKDDTVSLPSLWIRENRFDAEMQGKLLEILKSETVKLGEEELNSKKQRTGRRRRDHVGDRLRASSLEALNYRLIICEKTTTEAHPELASTRSELWCKAVYSAIISYLLLGVRAYVTDKPYLTISSPTDLKHIITLDAPHTLLRNILNQDVSSTWIRLSAAEENQTGLTIQDAMNAISALWVINEHLTSLDWGRNMDKDVASLLSQLNSNPLAGAAFYKERQRDGLPTTLEFTKSCVYLLERMGGWKLDLAKTLAHQSLAIFLPGRAKEIKGKAFQYERLFRSALDSLKKMAKVEEPDEMISRLAGELQKTVLRQEALNKESSLNGKINCDQSELKFRAEAFARTIVEELFLRRCGRSISKLLMEENSLADGIYHIIDCELDQHWKDYKLRKEMRKSLAETANKLSDIDVTSDETV